MITTRTLHGRRVRGFTLVETLVALLALSIGLLGIAAMQMTSLRANLSASWRSQANFLAYDIIDRMRVNRPDRADYVIAVGSGIPGGSTRPELDLAAWKTNLAAALPGGDGSVAVDGANVTVTVQWNDSKGDKGLADGQDELVFTTQTQI